MTEYEWDKFEWDDENKKNGNVQHLRDHGIEPDEAEECFFRDYEYCRDERRFDDVYILDGRTNRDRRLRLVFQDKGKASREFLRVGICNRRGKTMKKRFGKLPKAEQEKIELAYHQMNPNEFDEQMKRAKQHSPALIRLPPELIEGLKKQAKSTGESEYQMMVQRWIEERLQQETKAV